MPADALPIPWEPAPAPAAGPRRLRVSVGSSRATTAVPREKK